MNKFLLRTFTGAIYVLLIVGCVLWGGLIGFTILCCVLTLLGMIEFLRMTKGGGERTMLTSALDILIGLSLTLSLFLSRGSQLSLTVILAEIAFLILLRAVMELYTGSSRPATDIALSALSVIYVAAPLTIATYVDILAGAECLMLIFVMIWLNDTGAFLVGSAIGRHKLFERLSPKKSWEGFWGGAAFCVIAGWLAKLIFPSIFILPAGCYIGLGLVVCLFSTWGDLFESMIKRSAGVKDSGNILPGHGGILDRIDSLLFVMPASAIYLFILIYSLR
ncbi:MAG: phosphatidate cytidylyltransferase [Firmicutes bacterium]|nr:phosphatidate cytidylyltransferase [Bacillota bacterium]MCM1401133.1 phosphatidate cytidylyltransferase [Bacteroides sp.]MCM1477044.1 phosphatidate cytidylyltransferase [Bacteroides sp.]